MGRAHDERNRRRRSGGTNPASSAAAIALDDDDDCEICRALREGDDARAVQLVRDHPTNVEFQRLMSLDEDEFDAWLKAQGLDLDAESA
jgi:hypothetical protein